MALEDVCTTFATFRSRAARSTLAVPVTLTDQNRSRSLASGTWATLLRTTSTPSHAARSAPRSRTSPATYSTRASDPAGAAGPRGPGGLGSKMRTGAPRPRVVGPVRAIGRRLRSAGSGSSQLLPVLEAPADAGAHALLERHRRLVADLVAGPAHVAGDRVVELAQHVQRLDVPARPLEDPVGLLGGPGRQAGERDPRRPRGGQPLGLQRPADGGEDLAQLVGPLVRDPVGVAGRLVGHLGPQQPLDQVAGVGHRAALGAVAHEGEAAPADGPEELRLPGGLEGPVEPRGPDDHRRQVAPLVGAPHDELGLVLGPAVAQPRVVRRVLGEDV